MLNLWIMDQVPIGNKTTRPGYDRQIWCPACRGLLETPLALTSGHVLLECMVVEGTCCYISQAHQCNVVFERIATRQVLVPLMCSLSCYQLFQLANIALDEICSSQSDHHSLECLY